MPASVTTLAALMAPILAARGEAQAEYDQTLLLQLEAGSPLEERVQKLRGLLRELDSAQAALRQVLRVTREIHEYDAIPPTPVLAPPPVLESDIIRQVKRERDAAFAKIRELETGVTGPPLPKDEAP